MVSTITSGSSSGARASSKGSAQANKINISGLSNKSSVIKSSIKNTDTTNTDEDTDTDTSADSVNSESTKNYSYNDNQKYFISSETADRERLSGALRDFNNSSNDLYSIQNWQGQGAQLSNGALAISGGGAAGGGTPLASQVGPGPTHGLDFKNNFNGNPHDGGGGIRNLTNGGKADGAGVDRYDPSNIRNNVELASELRSEASLAGEEHAVADYLDQVINLESESNRAEKKSINYNSEDPNWTLGYMSGLDNSTVRELDSKMKEIGFNSNSLSTLAITSGIREASDITEAHKTIFEDYSTHALNRNGSFQTYRNLLDKYINSGFISPEVAKHVNDAEKILNYDKNMVRSTGPFALLGSTITVAKILNDPENAYQGGRGLSVGTAIASTKDGNGAFYGGNARGDFEGARAVLGSLGDKTDFGHLEVYLGNGMSDKEFYKRIDTLNSSAAGYNVASNGSVTAINGNTNEARAPWISMRQEGHGNPNGSYGVNGAFDKSDGAEVSKFAEKVYGGSFVLNCVACSNMKGSGSYGEWFADKVSEKAAKNTQIISHGSGVDTPLYKGHVFLGPGGIGHSLVGVNAPRIATTKGKTEINESQKEDMKSWGVDKYGMIVQKHNKDSSSSTKNEFNFS
jgi:hypothetical protein